MPEESSKHFNNTDLQDLSNFRIANPSELWTVLSRQLAFDDPSSKWQASRKALKKQLDKKQSIDAMSVGEQGRIFTRIFGSETKDDRNVDRHVNFVLALEDLRRFNELSFDSWPRADWKGEFPLQDETWNALFPQMRSSEKLWIHSAFTNIPGWSRLVFDNDCPDDPRLALIRDFISQFRRGKINKVEEPTFIWKELVDEQRDRLPGSFLPKIIVLVEGQTEALVLPTFANLLGFSLNKLAVHIEACGGAKQVVKHYLNWKELTVLPILCVLDADVSESAEIIHDSLRAQDCMMTVKAGEIEDSFSTPTFHRLLNLYLKEIGCLEPIQYADLKNANADRIETLDRLFRIRGLGNFDKIGFAETVAKNLNKSDVPDDGKRIIEAIRELNDAGIKLRFQ